MRKLLTAPGDASIFGLVGLFAMLGCASTGSADKTPVAPIQQASMARLPMAGPVGPPAAGPVPVPGVQVPGAPPGAPVPPQQAQVPPGAVPPRGVPLVPIAQGAAEDTAYYHTAAQVLQQKDPEAARVIDFRRFRRGSMLAGNVADMSMDADLKAAMATENDGRILAAAKKALEKDAAFLRAHLVASNVLGKMKRVPESQLHSAFINGILGSIARSGDGKSPATAFVVFDVREEYMFANSTGLRVNKQNIKQENGRVYDVLTVQRANNPVAAERQMYFDITELFAEEQRAIQKRALAMPAKPAAPGAPPAAAVAPAVPPQPAAPGQLVPAQAITGPGAAAPRPPTAPAPPR